MTGRVRDGLTDAATSLQAARTGDRAALARTLSMVERDGPQAAEISRLAVAGVDAGDTIGITGPPGVGKSTLTSGLIAHLRAGGDRVAVLAVDPTSAYTGGAILGDRLRMAEHISDDGVYIRSLATRGDLGGLSLATAGAVRVLRAVGFPWILLESVGVGQVQLAVEAACDTSVVLLAPGAGDSVQASKAGLMETGDVFVINKADLIGADKTRRDVEEALDLSPRDDWRPPVILAQATSGSGVAAVWAAVERHREHQFATGGRRVRRIAQTRAEMLTIVADRVRGLVARALDDDALRTDLDSLRVDPRDAAEQVLRRLLAS